MPSKPTEPKERFWTSKSIEKLAKMFALPNNNAMQDWPYEVSDPNRTEEFFDALEHFKTDEDTQYTLMDLILQSLEESQIELSDSKLVNSLRRYLKRNYAIHAYQIWYWATFDTELTDAWRISPFLRDIWNDMK